MKFLMLNFFYLFTDSTNRYNRIIIGEKSRGEEKEMEGRGKREGKER